MGALEGRYIDNGLLDFLVAERKAGRIRNLGFSYHGEIQVFDYLLSQHDKYHWDFVQIELNYLDWNYADEINYLKEWINKRIVWMDNILRYTPPEPVYIAGDVNNDGEVNIGDVTALIELLLSHKPLDDDHFLQADVDRDGELSIGDITALINLILSGGIA